jgi:hypothetical protein
MEASNDVQQEQESEQYQVVVNNDQAYEDVDSQATTPNISYLKPHSPYTEISTNLREEDEDIENLEEGGSVGLFQWAEVSDILQKKLCLSFSFFQICLFSLEFSNY